MAESGSSGGNAGSGEASQASATVPPASAPSKEAKIGVVAQQTAEEGAEAGNEVENAAGDSGEEQSLVLQGSDAARRGKKKKWGIPLSGLVNTLFLGLGSLGVYYGWQKKPMKNTLEFGLGVAWGSWSGLRFVSKYRKNRRVKDRLAHILRVDMGGKGILSVTRGAPYWLKLSEDEEKTRWLNILIAQAWPFYESAICKKVVEEVGPVLKQHKPGFVKSLFFEKMTFGGAPFKFTHMKVVRVTDSEVVLEAGLRWDGTAQVALGIELFSGACLTPSITRVNFFAEARVTLTPLCDKIPGFGAMLIALQKPPKVTFDLNAGAGLGTAVEAWLQPFLVNNILGTMLVWPNRLVIPILPEDVTGPLDRFKLRTKGILRVRVVEARGLKKQDLLAKGDPYVTLETVPLKPVKTKILSNTLTPRWDEELYLKVQEVEQDLNVEVMDYDNPALGTLTFSGDELYGRARICIKDLPQGKLVDNWFPLGKGAWGDIGGPGTGEGEIHLCLTYMTLDSLRGGQFVLTPRDKETNIHHGMLFCRMECAHNLVSVDREKLSDPYGVLWCHDIKKQTGIIKDTLDPEWNEHFEWPNVSSAEMLYVEVHDKGKISDKPMGRAQVPVCEIAQRFVADSHLDDLVVNLPLETAAGSKGSKGDVVLHLEWIPLDNLPIPQPKTKRSESLFSVVERGVLMIRLVHARGLKNVDLGGKSDPYVVFKLGGTERKSRVVANSLDPDWNEVFRWESTKPADVVKITVKDADVFTDRTLGVYEIGVFYASKQPGCIHSFKCQLSEKRKSAKAKGYLVLQMLWVQWDKHGDDPEPQEPEWPDIPDS